MTNISKSIAPLLTGLCGTCCGPCLSYGNAENLGENGIFYCFLWCFCTPCLPSLLLRRKVREKYRIQVSLIHDFHKTIF